MSQTIIKCKQCGQRLANHVVGCPSCGSTGRIFNMTLSTKVSVNIWMRAFAYTRSKTRWIQQIVSGYEPSKTLGKLVWKLRIMNKSQDKYYEHVEDPDSGQVLHHCEEPFSHHQGHGSAKLHKEQQGKP